MTTLSRSQFTTAFTPGTLDELRARASAGGVSMTARQETALRRADLDGNGIVGDSAAERRAAWTAVDSFDRNGSRGSVSSRTGGGYALGRALAPTARTSPDAPTGGSGGASASSEGRGGARVTAPTVSSSTPPDPIETEIANNDRNARSLERGLGALRAYRALPEAERTPERRAAVAHMVEAYQPLVDGAPPVTLGAPADDQMARLRLSRHDYATAAANFRDEARAAGF